MYIMKKFRYKYPYYILGAIKKNVSNHDTNYTNYSPEKRKTQQ